MGSSEDYLDSLLKSMGVPAELASPTKKAPEPVKEAPADKTSEEPVVSASKPSPKASASSGESALDDLLKQMSEPAPAAEEPVVEDIIEEPVVEEAPIEESPDESFVEEAVIEEPIEEETPIEEVSIAEELIEEPAVDEPVIEEPVIEEPSFEEDLAEELSVEEPVVEETIDHSADIPDLAQILNEDPAASDIHIDSAPSLEVTDEDSAMDADLSDLMSGLMSKIDSDETSDGSTVDSLLTEETPVDDSSVEEVSEQLSLDDLNLEDLGLPDDTVAADEASELEEALAVNEISALEEEPSAEEASAESSEDSPEEHFDIDDSFSSLLSEAESVLNEAADSSVEEDITDKSVADDTAVEISTDDLATEEAVEAPTEEDLDAQLAALLQESGETVESSESEKTAEKASDDFDLDAELAELMKEENESEGAPSEDDIESMLNKARAEGLADDEDRSEMSLDDLLAADSGSAGEIGELLNKSDNNEAVDPGIEALLNGTDESEVPDVLGEGEESEAPVDKAAEKKRLKEEKKEARRKAKEEKARLRKEAREAKKAKKKAGGVGEENTISSANAENADMSDVDALLAGAAEAAAEVKAAALTSEASAAPIEVPTENSEIDEADSLLAEIMGNPLSEEDLYDALSEGSESEGSSDDKPAEEPVSLPADELDELLEKEAKEKKPKKGLIAKIIDLLTETDEDDEEGEASEIKLSEENAEVLEQLEAEDGDGKKGKKKKKKKDKGKKADDAGEGEEGEEGEGGGKKEKKKKSKKEKKPKNEEPEKPGKKLNKKKVIAIFALCATILVAVLIISNLLGTHSVKQEAREAYSAGDYQTAYQDLFGMELNESDKIIFKKSECILKIRLWYREYELLRDESDVKALDSLIQSVNNYPDLYESAVKWQCLEEVEPVYNQIVEALYNEFGLTEEEAREIAMIKKDVDYTRAVYDVVNGLYGNSQDAEEQSEEETEAPEVLEDIIPGEEDPGDDIVFVNP